MQGAMAFPKGLGAVHSLSHSLGGLAQRPHHGTLNALLLPEIVKFNDAAVPEKGHAIAGMFGVDGGAGLTDALRDLNRRIGLPSGLGAMGIPRGAFDGVIANALERIIATQRARDRPAPRTAGACWRRVSAKPPPRGCRPAEKRRPRSTGRLWALVAWPRL